MSRRYEDLLAKQADLKDRILTLEWVVEAARADLADAEERRDLAYSELDTVEELIAVYEYNEARGVEDWE